MTALSAVIFLQQQVMGKKRMIFVSSEREESVTLSDLIPRPELSIMVPMKAKMIALKMM